MARIGFKLDGMYGFEYAIDGKQHGEEKLLSRHDLDRGVGNERG
jgi:hypothetical protein